MMALHNMNTLHWHLTDDQGWRIESKKYPLLTQIGSKRKETLIGHLNDRPENTTVSLIADFTHKNKSKTS